MKKKRKKYDSSFKAKVAIEAIREHETLTELSAKYELSLVMISRWIERFWRTIKYEYIYIHPEDTGAELYQGIKRSIDDYNYNRRHQGINHRAPGKIYLKEVA